MAVETTIVAGTAIARRGVAALIRGQPGQGKSDLALRAICHPIQLPGESVSEPFHLVSDDQTVLSKHNGYLIASPPRALHGLIEVRGIGIVATPSVAEAPLALIVDIVQSDIERLPEYPGATDGWLGCTIDVVCVAALEASAPLKIALALARAVKHRGYVT